MVFRTTVALAAGAVVDNLLAGQSIEFAPDDSRLSLAATTSVAGALNASLRLTDEVVLDTSILPLENIAGSGPVLPDNFLLTKQAVARGDHLILRVQNTSAGAANVSVIVDVSAI